jgi:RNA polymerase sigma factor (sigma-70 family)
MLDIDRLIRQVSPGDPQVCEALMGVYYDFVYNLASSFLSDPEEADDVAQETFINAALHVDHYHAGTSIKSWLAKIAINLCRDRYRRRRVRQRLVEVLKRVTLQPDPSPVTPEENLLQNERQLHIKKAIDALDDKHRLPLLLRYYHGLSVPEIARALELSEGTVHSRLHYAHLKLRSQLAGSFEVKEGNEERME